MFFITLVIWSPSTFIEGLFRGAVGGALGGACLGLALRDWRRTGLLALAGAIGFGVAMEFRLESYILEGGFLSTEMPHMLIGATYLSIIGVVGGASLGAALGFLERSKARQHNEHNQ